MHKTITKQVLITFYSDGTSRYSELTRVLPERDATGRFVPKHRPAAARQRRHLVDPDDIPGLDEHGNVTRRVTCPDCGLVFMRSFKILKPES